MKNLRFLYYLLFAAVVPFLSSCGDDDQVALPPSVSFVNATGSASVQPGDSVTVRFVANKGDANLSTFAVTVNGNNYGKYNNGIPKTNIPNDTYQDSVRLVAPAVAGQSNTYTFTATDNDGLSGTASFTVNAVSDISTYTTVLLGGQSNTTTGSFYDAEGNTVYNQADAKTNASLVDFLYFYGATNLATIAAPNDVDAATIYNNASTGLQTWTVRNATLIGTTTLTAAQFDAIQTSAELGNAAGTPGGTKVNNLANGSVFAFETVDGKKGLGKVTNVTGTQSGSITITVKVQQ